MGTKLSTSQNGLAMLLRLVLVLHLVVLISALGFVGLTLFLIVIVPCILLRWRQRAKKARRLFLQTQKQPSGNVTKNTGLASSVRAEPPSQNLRYSLAPTK